MFRVPSSSPQGGVSLDIQASKESRLQLITFMNRKADGPRSSIHLAIVALAGAALEQLRAQQLCRLYACSQHSVSIL